MFNESISDVLMIFITGSLIYFTIKYADKLSKKEVVKQPSPESDPSKLLKDTVTFL